VTEYEVPESLSCSRGDNDNDDINNNNNNTGTMFMVLSSCNKSLQELYYL